MPLILKIHTTPNALWVITVLVMNALHYGIYYNHPLATFSDSGARLIKLVAPGNILRFLTKKYYFL